MGACANVLPAPSEGKETLIKSGIVVPAPDRVEGRLRPGTQATQALLDPRLRGDDNRSTVRYQREREGCQCPEDCALLAPDKGCSSGCQPAPDTCQPGLLFARQTGRAVIVSELNEPGS